MIAVLLLGAMGCQNQEAREAEALFVENLQQQLNKVLFPFFESLLSKLVENCIDICCSTSKPWRGQLLWRSYIFPVRGAFRRL